uniref:Uncharacterized protein n=1 Tax=Arundo donax TaxID=35708 RepID=A0A0A8ZCD9_ARUDO
MYNELLPVNAVLSPKNIQDK